MYLGIDLGTSSLKASLADGVGRIIDSASASYPLLSPFPNWSEQNPEDWYRALGEVLAILSSRHDLRAVKALSFCGQMHGLVVLDEKNKVIRPAILWNDSRTTAEVEELNVSFGKERLIKETGNIALCGFTAPKLLWLRKHEPDNFKIIRKIMLPKDYLAFRLSGVFGSDLSDLSGTLFFDVRKGDYSEALLTYLGIKSDMVPRVFRSFEVLGTVQPAFAKENGLSDQTKVVIGGGDQAVGAIGSGTIDEGTLSVSLGTSGVVFAPSDSFLLEPEGRIHSFRAANGRFHLMGCTLSAAASLKWWIEDILRERDYPMELRGMPETIDDILFLPYLSGERSPINDPFAQGAFYGLNSFYGRKSLTKALLEGISFSLYDNLLVMQNLGLHFKKARVIGGGANSPEWLQILSDVFGLPIATVETKDGGTFGAIALAMVGDGFFRDLHEACEALIHEHDVYTPDMECHKVYEKKFARYKEIYSRLKGF